MTRKPTWTVSAVSEPELKSAGHPANPGACRHQKTDEGGLVHECDLAPRDNHPRHACWCGQKWPRTTEDERGTA